MIFLLSSSGLGANGCWMETEKMAMAEGRKKLKPNSGNIAKHLQVKNGFSCNNIKERMEIYDDSLRRPFLSSFAKCDGCEYASDGEGMN